MSKQNSKVNVQGLSPAQRSAETRARVKAGYDSMTPAQKSVFTRQRNTARANRLNLKFGSRPQPQLPPTGPSSPKVGGRPQGPKGVPAGPKNPQKQAPTRKRN